MLIDTAKKTILDADGFETAEYPGLRIYYSGVLYAFGRKAGKDTVDLLAQEVAAGAIRFRSYFGAYIVVVERDDGELLLWCDNSYMRNVYRSEHFIGTDICAVARAEGCSALDEAALCEFLTFTRTYTRQTLIRGISVLENDQYCRIGTRLELLDKGIGTLCDPPLFADPENLFREMCLALREKNTICALTGGYDSRLIAAVFNYYGKSDCFISGDNPDSEDIRTARAAAGKGGIDLQVLVPRYDRSGDLSDALRAQFDRGSYAAPMSTSGFRITWFRDELQRRGYDVLLTGDAGGMHKDFWFKQDFPFYWSKRSDMKKLVDSRFVVTRKDQYLGAALQPLYRQVIGQTYAFFDGLKRDRNARSYLLAAWEEWASTSMRQPGPGTIAMYAPLQEFELAKYSYSILPRGKRMNMFHRTYISRYQPEMASVRTIYGTNASDRRLDLALDAILGLRQTARSAYRYLYRRAFRRDMDLFRSVNRVDLDDAIRSSALCREALAWAVGNGYIRKDAQPLPTAIAGKLIYCFLLERALGPEGA